MKKLYLQLVDQKAFRHKKSLSRRIPPLSLTKLDNRHLLGGDPTATPESPISYEKIGTVITGAYWGSIFGYGVGVYGCFVALIVIKPTPLSSIETVIHQGPIAIALGGAIIGASLGAYFYELTEPPAETLNHKS